MLELSGKYTSAKIMIDEIESEAVGQIHTFLNHPAFTNPIRIMPDVHKGKGSVIGFTMPLGEKIIPNVVGVDIGCVDRETEFLSPTGWCKISKYNGQKVLQYNRTDGTAEFVTPTNYIKAPCSEFYHLKSKYGIDQKVSSDHKVFCKVPYGRKREWVEKDLLAQELYAIHDKQVLGFKGRFVTTFIPKLTGQLPYSEAVLRVLVMVAADGCFPRKTDWCAVKVRKKRKIDRVQLLLNNACIDYKTKKYDNGDQDFRFYSPGTEKILSWWGASLDQLKIIVEECLKWDGTEKLRVFFTRKKESADFINYAMSAVGYRSIIKTDKRKDGSVDYRVFANLNTETSLSSVPKTPITIEKSEDGYKYCFTVPSGYWVMRRNGRIAITGNCGMLAMNIGRQLNIDLEHLDHKIRQNVPFGQEVHENSVIRMKKEFPWKKVAVKAEKLSWGYRDKFGTWYDTPKFDMDWFEGKVKRIGASLSRVINSLGTLGGGNHFIETGLDETGDYWVTIHTGSRNLGKCVCEYWQGKAIKKLRKENASWLKEEIEHIRETEKGEAIYHKIQKAKIKAFPARGIDSKGLEWLEEADAAGYLFDMVFAQIYAETNRELIKNLICKALKVDPTMVVETVHNFIDFEDFIIRKGAIRSYAGEEMIIPFNMRDGILLCEGKSNPDWNFSAPHGAGRVLSRSAARKKLDVEDFKSQMEGIYSTSVGSGTIDEAPDAYKDAKLIEDAIGPTATILRRIKPIHNMKDNSDFSYYRLVKLNTV